MTRSAYLAAAAAIEVGLAERRLRQEQEERRRLQRECAMLRLYVEVVTDLTVAWRN